MEQVLIVDDSPAARMIVRRCLRIAGLESEQVLEAEHGRAALEVLKRTPVHLVVSDLNMPVMDGHTLLRFMRSSPRLRDIPVVVVSSLVNAATRDSLSSLQPVVILKKPLNAARMAEALGQVSKVRRAS